MPLNDVDISNKPYQSYQNTRKAIFNPPLATQRYTWVQSFAEREPTIMSITDVGCGNGRMLNWLKAVENLDKINCIDKDHTLLECEMDHHMRPNLHEMLFGRRGSTKPLNINVYHGDIAVPDDRLRADCFTLVEMIEHITLDQVERVCRSVFGFYQPKFVVVTTPNREFNHLLREQGGANSCENAEYKNNFRHYDHKFEWTRAEFMKWAENVCSLYPYTVQFDGVGKLENSEPYGPCTQIAVFRRSTETQTGSECDLTCFDMLLNKLSVEEGRPEFCGDDKLKKICLLTTFAIPGSQDNPSTRFPPVGYWNDDQSSDRSDNDESMDC